MPSFYKHQLTRTLQDALEAALDQSPDEQLQLFEELALMRMLALRCVKLWDAAEGLESQGTAADLMRQALREVVSTCEAAARVHNVAKDKFSVHNLMHVVQTIVRIAHEVMGEDEAKAKEFEALVYARVKLASPGGTTITPDQEVLDMDSTIPKE